MSLEKAMLGNLARLPTLSLATLLLPAAGAPIEPKLTTAQLDQAKKLVAGWRELDFTRMKATAIPVPGKADQTCPPMP